MAEVLNGQVFIASGTAEREKIYKLRHRCYARDGMIEPRIGGLFTDEYDEAENAIILGLRVGNELAASIRIHYLTAHTRVSPTVEAFPDFLSWITENGATAIEGSRFVVEGGGTIQRRAVAFRTLAIPLVAADLCRADYGIAAVKTKHIDFYSRYGGFTCMAAPRTYNGLRVKLALLMVDLRRESDRIRSSNAHFRSQESLELRNQLAEFLPNTGAIPLNNDKPAI